MIGGGREMEQDDKLLGRERPDVDKLFPRYTHATAATTGEVTVNGKTLKLWTFAQLEALNAMTLRQRANAIRDAVGQADCPPLPSQQPADLTRWILHMQSELTQEKPAEGRTGGYGTGHLVPQSFAQDTKERPIGSSAARAQQPMPFGPRGGYNTSAARDSYGDLKYNRNQFAEAPTQGIVSMRDGGEGRRHIGQKDNMIHCGVSDVRAETNEGRRYIGCKDNLGTDMHAANTQCKTPSSSTRASDRPTQHVSESHMAEQGTSEPLAEPHIGGERRRHAAVPDRMVNQGTADAGEDLRKSGRKPLDCFAGSAFSHSSSQDSYKSNWKKDPSRLLGTNLLC